MKTLIVNINKGGELISLTLKEYGTKISEENPALVETYKKSDINIHSYVQLSIEESILLGKWLENAINIKVEVDFGES
jgi:hypothetical protein